MFKKEKSGKNDKSRSPGKKSLKSYEDDEKLEESRQQIVKPIN